MLAVGRIGQEAKQADDSSKSMALDSRLIAVVVYCCESTNSRRVVVITFDQDTQPSPQRSVELLGRGALQQQRRPSDSYLRIIDILVITPRPLQQLGQQLTHVFLTHRCSRRQPKHQPSPYRP